MDKVQEIIREAIDLEENTEVQVLANKNIDLDKVVELAGCYVNDDWALKIKELLDTGWVLFRIQTELHPDGHVTMAYFAKMKTE